MFHLNNILELWIKEYSILQILRDSENKCIYKYKHTIYILKNDIIK